MTFPYPQGLHFTLQLETRQMNPPPIPVEALNQSIESQNGHIPIHTMKGVQDLMEVYADKVAITPTGIFGFLNKGVRGTKTIPFKSIAAVRFKKATFWVSGCIAFTVPGEYRSENAFGLSGVSDENAFLYRGETKGENELALEIKNYIERRVDEMRSAPATASSSIADELQKFAVLKAQGVLSESEFAAAKKRLLS
jgi:hypothetical protein